MNDFIILFYFNLFNVDVLLFYNNTAILYTNMLIYVNQYTTKKLTQKYI